MAKVGEGKRAKKTLGAARTQPLLERWVQFLRVGSTQAQRPAPLKKHDVDRKPMPQGENRVILGRVSFFGY